MLSANVGYEATRTQFCIAHAHTHTQSAHLQLVFNRGRPQEGEVFLNLVVARSQECLKKVYECIVCVCGESKDVEGVR